MKRFVLVLFCLFMVSFVYAAEQKTIGNIPIPEWADIVKVAETADTSSSIQKPKYADIRVLYEKDINMCQLGYTNPKELVGCYMRVKQHYELLLSNSMNFEKIRREIWWK